MPRPASMSPMEAETLIGVPAGSDVIVTSENRVYLRKWAVACGHPSAIVYKMSNEQLAQLYRGDDREGIVETPVTHEPAPMNAPINHHNDASAQLAALIQSIAGNAVNEDRVREIVTDALASFQPQTVETRKVLEIRRPDQTSVSLEGHNHHVLETVILAVGLNHPVMMVGPAGCGKTTIGEKTAAALGLSFYITHVVFDTHELMGFVDGHGNYHRTSFRDAFENGGVWIADEVDAWDSSALLAANAALSNGYCTFPDSQTPVKRHADFRLIATANTYGHGADRLYVGRNQLDAATLDRFATIDMDYDEALETMISTNPDWLAHVHTVRARIREKSIRHVVSTRAILMGQDALAIGMDWETVEKLYLFKGMSENDRKMI